MNRPLGLTLADAAQAGEPHWSHADPVAQAELDPAPDLLVVGAGLAGLAVAAAARRAGVDRVQVIDRSGVVGAASGRNAGAVIPDVHALTMPAPFGALARRGLALHRELHTRWGLAWRTIDWLVPVEHDHDLPDPGAATASRATLLEGDRLEERLGTPTPLDRAVLVPDQGATDPVRFGAALARDAGRVTVGVRATGLQLAADSVAVVDTTAGPIRPGALVLATGRVPDRFAPDQLWVKGHLALTAPAPFDLRGAAIGGRIVVIPQPDGRLLVGGTQEPDVADGAVDRDVTAGVRDELARLLPAAARITFERSWTAQRPATADRLPIVDRLPGASNGYLIAGLYHSGLCNAPAIGEALAEAITGGELPDRVRPFGLDRT